jgi:OOP family OmpA-OmpF porin
MRTRAEELARVYGFNLVDNQITLASGAVVDAAAIPYRLQAELASDGQVVLSGEVPDAASHEAIVKAAQDRFGADNVIDRLIEKAGAPTGWLEAAITGLKNLKLMNSGSLELLDQALTLSGEVASDDISGQVMQAVNADLPGGYQSAYNLVAPAASMKVEPAQTTVSEPVLTVEEKAEAMSCQDQFNRLLGQTQINFQTASDEINPDSFSLLDQLASVAEECPAARIVIEGHTDSRGRDVYNQSLSESRAVSVLDYLLAKGLPSNRLSAIGYGESQPIADNNTEEGRAINRRIEFTVKGI